VAKLSFGVSLSGCSLVGAEVSSLSRDHCADLVHRAVHGSNWKITRPGEGKGKPLAVQELLAAGRNCGQKGCDD